MVALAQAEAGEQLIPDGEHEAKVPLVRIPVDVIQKILKSNQALHADEDIPPDGRIVTLVDHVVFKADDVAVRLEGFQGIDLSLDVFKFFPDSLAQARFGASRFLQPLADLCVVLWNWDDFQSCIKHAARRPIPNSVDRAGAAPAEQFRRVRQLPGPEKGHISPQSFVNTLHAIPHRPANAPSHKRLLLAHSPFAVPNPFMIPAFFVRRFDSQPVKTLAARVSIAAG